MGTVVALCLLGYVVLGSSSCGDDARSGADAALDITDNPLLTSIDGIATLTSVGDELRIRQNGQLTSIQQLDPLAPSALRSTTARSRSPTTRTSPSVRPSP